MDTPTPSPEPSWGNLILRARGETPPDIDVRFDVRRRILAETLTHMPTSRDILDDVWAISCGFRGIAAFGCATLAILGFAWLSADMIGEISLAIQFQTQLISGL